jgi:hypothetical protein
MTEPIDDPLEAEGWREAGSLDLSTGGRSEGMIASPPGARDRRKHLHRAGKWWRQRFHLLGHPGVSTPQWKLHSNLRRGFNFVMPQSRLELGGKFRIALSKEMMTRMRPVTSPTSVSYFRAAGEIAID